MDRPKFIYDSSAIRSTLSRSNSGNDAENPFANLARVLSIPQYHQEISHETIEPLGGSRIYLSLNRSGGKMGDAADDRRSELRGRRPLGAPPQPITTRPVPNPTQNHRRIVMRVQYTVSSHSARTSQHLAEDEKRACWSPVTVGHSTAKASASDKPTIDKTA